MSTVKLSEFLAVLVEEKTITPQVAARLNRLPLTLQPRAIAKLPVTIDQAVDQLCQQLEHPDVKVLYNSRTHNTEGGGLQHWLYQAWRSARISTLMRWAIFLWLLWFLLTSALGLMRAPFRWAHKFLSRSGHQSSTTEVFKKEDHLRIAPVMPLKLAPSALPNPSASRISLPSPRFANNSPVGIYPPPVKSYVEVLTPDLIRLSWRAVAKDARYNVYSSASRRMTSPRKENIEPMKSNIVEWTPETGLDRYWIVVTTLDPQDGESAFSEAIEVIRRPEAARDLRKVLPW